MYREYEYFLHEVNAKMRLQVSFILSASLFGHMLRERKKGSKYKTNTSILEIYLLEKNSHGREQGKRTGEENSSYYIPCASTVKEREKIRKYCKIEGKY